MLGAVVVVVGPIVVDGMVVGIVVDGIVVVGVCGVEVDGGMVDVKVEVDGITVDVEVDGSTVEVDGCKVDVEIGLTDVVEVVVWLTWFCGVAFSVVVGGDEDEVGGEDEVRVVV